MAMGKEIGLALALVLVSGAATAAEDMGTPHATPLIFSKMRSDQDLSIVGGEIAFTWETDIWVGGDYHKGWLKTEGEIEEGALHEAEVELLYSRYLAKFFDVQIGVRHDFKPDGAGQTTYGVIGIQGLAPYRFEVDAALFFSEHGDVAFRAELEYFLWLTQRLVVQPYFEADLWLTRNSVMGLAAGLAEIDSGVKILYEVRREFAPYIDLNVVRTLGSAKSNAILLGERVKDFAVRVGARVIF
ncbi:MAG TPA: copper resistance protein B [Sphingomonadales bacterium]|nr:copper resistance protein B [Sphingomonadales bacterium]